MNPLRLMYEHPAVLMSMLRDERGQAMAVELLEAVEQLARCAHVVREDEDVLGGQRAVGVKQMADALDHHGRLAGTATRKHHERTVAPLDGGALRRRWLEVADSLRHHAHHALALQPLAARTRRTVARVNGHRALQLRAPRPLRLLPMLMDSPEPARVERRQIEAARSTDAESTTFATGCEESGRGMGYGSDGQNRPRGTASLPSSRLNLTATRQLSALGTWTTDGSTISNPPGVQPRWGRTY